MVICLDMEVLREFYVFRLEIDDNLKFKYFLKKDSLQSFFALFLFESFF